MASQPERCIVCGEDTAAGTPLFSDRLTDTKDGTRRFLCSICAARARGSREVHSDAEREEDLDALLRAAFVWGSFAPGGH